MLSVERLAGLRPSSADGPKKGVCVAVSAKKIFRFSRFPPLVFSQNLISGSHNFHLSVNIMNDRI